MRMTGDEKWRDHNVDGASGFRLGPEGRWEMWAWHSQRWMVFASPQEWDVIVSYDDTWCEPHEDFDA